MPHRRQNLGKKGETLAAGYLKKCGYKILEMNYRNKLGEIDIIARDKGTIVFVEVKSRRTDRFGSAKNAVRPAKQRKISMVALWYLKATKQMYQKARFDVVAIAGDGDHPKIDIVKNAFDLAYT